MNSYLKKRTSHFFTWTVILIVLALSLNTELFATQVPVLLMTALIPWGLSLLMLIAYPTSAFAIAEAFTESAVLALSPELAYCDPEETTE